MSKKKQTTQRRQVQKKPKTEIVSAEEVNLSLSFEEARIKAKQQRSERIDNAMDSAIQILGDLLDDPKLDRVSKLYPAKTVIDLYTTKEKLALEEKKVDLDQKKVELERAKLSAPGGPLFVINNGEINQQKTVVQAPESIEALQERKHAQAKLLEEVSGIPQFVTEESIKKEDS